MESGNHGWAGGPNGTLDAHLARMARQREAVPWWCVAGAGAVLVALNLWGTTAAHAALFQEGTGQIGARSDPHELTQRVSEALIHGPPEPVRLRDNWLLWLGGRLAPDLRASQSPRRLAAGWRGLCSDAVIVLNALVQGAGYDAQMFDLNGHVVSELRRHGSVWVADPDLGLVHAGSVAEVSAAERTTEVRGAVLAAGHGEGIADACAAAFATAEDNRAVPEGVLNPRLWYAEQASEWLKWILPMGLLVWAGRALVGQEKGPSLSA